MFMSMRYTNLRFIIIIIVINSSVMHMRVMHAYVYVRVWIAEVKLSTDVKHQFTAERVTGGGDTD